MAVLVRMTRRFFLLARRSRIRRWSSARSDFENPDV
jgi:hypothetical protein